MPGRLRTPLGLSKARQAGLHLDAWNRLGEISGSPALVLTSDGNLARAKQLHLTRGASLWDALILAACVEAGVETFYSEDLPGFDDLDGVRIVNPFKWPRSEGPRRETQGQGVVGLPNRLLTAFEVAEYIGCRREADRPCLVSELSPFCPRELKILVARACNRLDLEFAWAAA
jgi:hypothetical protein